jgi:LytS/YehU family sensor histidine kinase
VPSLILQPLVENAVAHGMTGHDRPVTISVEFEVDRDTLTLSVVNDMGPAVAVRDDGIGLRNVRERLAAHFGDQAGFHTEAAAGVWRAEIKMPLVRSR